MSTTNSVFSNTAFVHDQSIQFPKLRQQNLESGRVYLVEGTHDVYPSITRVLGSKEKPALQAWKKRVGPAEAERVSRTATRQGSSLHAAAEAYLNNEPVPKMMPNVMELWIILRAWLDEHITCVYQQETDVFSRRLCVAGRFDLLAAIDGLLSVVDFKTSKRFKKDEYLLDYKLQGTFYACAVYELTGHKVSQIALPVMYPGGLQVVTFKPFTYFDELRRRIDQFYATAVA